MEKITYYMKYKVPLLPLLFFSVVALVGFWNLTHEEAISFRSYVQQYEFSDKNVKILSGNTIVFGTFNAIEPRLGIVSFRFQKQDYDSGSALVFRIKEKGSKKWFYEHTYTANQLHVNDWYPFGFPVIEQSPGRMYEFEIEGVAEKKEDAIILLGDRGFLVQYLLPNVRLFTPFNRIFLLFQENVKGKAKDALILFGGFVIVMFMFSFLMKRMSIAAKKLFMTSIFIYIVFWQFRTYQTIQLSTICILILTIYSGVLTGLLNSAKILILSVMVFVLMSIYYILGYTTVADRLSEWLFCIILVGMFDALAEINTKSPKYIRKII